ncbi:MAG: beta-ketoacyl-[acyl-carrier-protein] synthase family protein [Phycisphaerales bacterium JB039]
MRREVVITGVGVVSGLGLGAEALWDGLVACRSCLAPITRFDATGFACRLAGDAGDIALRDHVPKSYRKATKVMARDTELAVVAADLAAQQAGLRTRAQDGEPTYPAGRIGTHIGAGLIAAEADELAAAFVTAAEGGAMSLRIWGERGMGNLTPLWMLKYLPNMLACHVTIIHGCEGPSNTITCAEASALLCLGESARVIERGDADCCFSGGAESKVNQMGLTRFTLAGRMATTGAHESGADFVRPYDPEAPGQITGEAGAILVLEGADAAEARGAAALARISGFGAGQSPAPVAPLLERPPADFVDDGLVGAIEGALQDAGLAPDQIDVIVPHGAGHRVVDQIEAGALAAVFGRRLAELPLITITPNIGESWAGAGGVQAAAAVMALRRQMIPARIHAGTAPPGLQAGRAQSQRRSLRHALVCTHGLGGQNAAMVLSRVQG